jgi:serine/threonine-protein kinase
MNYDNKIKLIDFGMARLGSTADVSSFGMVLGDWAYLSPEQFAGDTRPAVEQDVFGVGATLYHLITGKPPYMRGRGLLREKGPPAKEITKSMPRALEEAINTALSDDPVDRFPTISDMLATLQSVT